MLQCVVCGGGTAGLVPIVNSLPRLSNGSKTAGIIIVEKYFKHNEYIQRISYTFKIVQKLGNGFLGLRYHDVVNFRRLGDTAQNICAV
jgi:hypothetical protein